MQRSIAQKTKFLVLVLICVVIAITGFNFLILKQDQILRKYFIDAPKANIKEFNASLANSLSKYFERENRTATLEEASEYIRRYGRTSLFEQVFIFKAPDGTLQQASKLGITPARADVLASDHVYPATIAGGALEGYLIILIDEMDSEELKEGLVKYRVISYSIRAAFLLLILMLLVIIFYQDYSAKMRLARDMAEIKASNDGLTGLHTHEHFMKALEIEVKKFKIYQTPIALLMLDIDHFKDFNDRYGHLAGDKVLQEVANLVKLNTRATDILARYGGEEFSVIMPYVVRDEDITKEERLRGFTEEIKEIAERIRTGVEGRAIDFQSNALKVTISIGVSFYYFASDKVSSSELIQRADSALYKAKELGRNRVCIDHELSSSG
ncbi:MAG: GGDEF domain-containing protein [Candidatus Omnitrophica bacterium]|nr:GGDEF domain-containing protein [Candidatus Omnitrophota bacterium]